MKKNITKRKVTSHEVRLKTHAGFKRSRADFHGSIGRRLITVLFVAGLFCGILYLCYSAKYHSSSLAAANAYFSKIKHSLSSSKPSLNHPRENKQNRTLVTENESQEASIHFEFYDTLPNMQITVPKQNDEVMTLPAINNKIAKPLPSALNKADIIKPDFRADELERDLSLQIKKRKIKTKKVLS